MVPVCTQCPQTAQLNDHLNLFRHFTTFNELQRGPREECPASVRRARRLLPWWSRLVALFFFFFFFKFDNSLNMKTFLLSEEHGLLIPL